MDLIKVCDSLKVPFVAVRNKIDLAEDCDEPFSPQEWKTIDSNKIKRFLTDQKLFRAIFQLSARNVFLNKTKATAKPTYDWDLFVEFLGQL